jgi:hypothetical protein
MRPARCRAWSSGRSYPNARGNTPIAKAFDCDFGLVAWDLAHPRAGGNAVLDPEPQRLGRRLGVGRNSDVDEVDHVTLRLKGRRRNWTPRGAHSAVKSICMVRATAILMGRVA